MASNERRRYVRRSEKQWRHLILRYRESGISVAAFCRAEAVSEANFYRWRARIEGDSAVVGGNAVAPGFVDLGALELAKGSGMRLELKLGRIFTLSLVRG